jgi:hypothetical protein
LDFVPWKTNPIELEIPGLYYKTGISDPGPTANPINIFEISEFIHPECFPQLLTLFAFFYLLKKTVGPCPLFPVLKNKDE